MIDFSNMLNKPIRHCFVPADKASITFVFEDGMRRSFGVGAGNVLALEQPQKTEGCKISSVEVGRSSRAEGEAFSALFFTDRESIVFRFKSTDGAIYELPE